MSVSKILLRNLLAALVEEWGAEQVFSALSQVSNPDNEGVRVNRVGRYKAKKASLSAVDQVARSSLDANQKVLLLELADRFDRKQFLPSNTDVKEFLIMTSHRPGIIKNRSEAFRILLKVLESVPVERLNQLTKTSRLSGPSQLGPLSDAISDAGASLSRRGESRDS